MRALMYLGTREMEIHEDVSEPKVTPGQVILRVGAASICGSDLHGFLGKSAKRVPPLIMGHEFTGEIVDLGLGVDRLSIGDRVTVNPILSCSSRWSDPDCGDRHGAFAPVAGVYLRGIPLDQRTRI